MMYWTREVVGWVLVGLGVIAFAITYFGLLRTGHIFESVPMAFIGFVVFRGGIHLVKVAVAARICQETSEHEAPKTVRALAVRRPLPGQNSGAPPLSYLPAEPVKPRG